MHAIDPYHVCCLQVARVAKMMVTQMGFSKKLGQLSWSSGGGNPFMGNQMGQAPDCSMTTSDDIDTEVRTWPH